MKIREKDEDDNAAAVAPAPLSQSDANGGDRPRRSAAQVASAKIKSYGLY